MAAFVHRGFGRVGGDFLPIAEVPADVSVPTGWTLDLTAGGVPGNTGFVKIDAEVSIANFGLSALSFFADLQVDGVDVLDDGGYETVGAEELGNIGLTAAVPVSTGAVHTVSVAIGGGDGLSFADGTVTAAYYPFGSTGGNILSTGTAANAERRQLSRTQGTNRFEEDSDGRCLRSSHRVNVLEGEASGPPPQALSERQAAAPSLHVHLANRPIAYSLAQRRKAS